MVFRRFLINLLPVLFVMNPVGASDQGGSTPQCHVEHKTPEEAMAHDGQAAVVPKPSDEVWPAQVNVAVTENDLAPRGDEKIKSILFKDMLIDRIYPSMRGPWTRKFVSLDGGTGQHVWVRRYRAEILDGVTGAASQEYMCHTNMDSAGSASSPNPFQRVRSWLSISQGQKEITFPRGYALRIPSTPEYVSDVNVMILNNNDSNIHKKLDFKVTIGYMDDAAAQKNRLIPLTQTAAGVNCPTISSPQNQGDTVCEPASKFLVSSGGDQRTGHWLVPPGRHTYSQTIGRLVGQDTTVHYIWMHVHPYAESMELRDKTTGTLVWKGRVDNDPRRAVVRSTDHYSSPRGIALHKDHDYDVIATYNNRTSGKIDAMAALWMYTKATD